MEKAYALTIRIWGSRHKIARYLISGGTATAVNFTSLYLFTEKVGFHYLVSATLAFITALGVSFVLQKFWTFKDNDTANVHHQAIVYGAVAIINTLLNLLFVYLLVEYAGLHYLAGQFVSSAFIAFESYFIYQLFIFKKKPVEHSSLP